jgi:lysophospholipid acyltransferase (LPLAT)-like uncharacterized protein
VSGAARDAAEQAEAEAEQARRDRARHHARRRQAKRRRRRLAAAFVVTLAVPFLRLLARTWRIEREGVFDPAPGQPRMLAFWHGRMLLPVAIHATEDTHVLVSESQDGAVIATLLERLGFGIVRGSSKRGGARALRHMLRNLGAGQSVVITPDGPLGPRHSIASGAAWLARTSGLAIVPLGLAARWTWTLRTWDRFTIPLPFSRVAVTYGPALNLSGDDRDLERDKERIREAIQAAERRSFERVGREPDW